MPRENAPACPQYSEGWNAAQAADWDEDCLTLDVRTPSLEGARPVMVWIHGGSNRSGASGGPADSDLTRQGVVVVGIQYRLGVLGYLAHPRTERGAGRLQRQLRADGPDRRACAGCGTTSICSAVILRK